jgi:hypothetical protein
LQQVKVDARLLEHNSRRESGASPSLKSANQPVSRSSKQPRRAQARLQGHIGALIRPNQPEISANQPESSADHQESMDNDQERSAIRLERCATLLDISAVQEERSAILRDSSADGRGICAMQQENIAVQPVIGATRADIMHDQQERSLFSGS